MYTNTTPTKFAYSLLFIAMSTASFTSAAQQADTASSVSQNAVADKEANASDQQSIDKEAIERINVTSQRRVQSIIDVPISVSAFTKDDLEQGGITEAADYLTLTPNVGFSEDGEGGSRSINIAIRGVSNIVLDGVASANSIGYYIDELSVGSVAQGTINPNLFDMNQVEVLRGPQGTYFGRNAVGGALNITTNKPDDELLFKGSVGVGNFGTRTGDAVVNIPVNDKFMIRGVFSHEKSDTPITNISPTGTDPFYKYNSGRLAFRYLPSDDLTLDLSVTKTKEDEGGDISIPSGVQDLDSQSIFGGDGKGFDEGPGFYPNNRDTIARDSAELNNKDFTIVNARVAWELDGVTFKSITGWLDSSFDRVADLDGVAQTFGPLPLRRVNDYSGESFSQEFRLQSFDSGPVGWTVGVYYGKDKLDRTNQIQILPDENPNGTPVGFINNNIEVFELDSKAIFGEVNWAIDDIWSVTAGGRYSQDKVFASHADLNRGPTPLAGSETFNDFSPKVVLKYQPNGDTTLFGSISKGYKADGVDVTGRSRVKASKFDPEELVSYEIGYKGFLLDNKLRLSGALFYLNWEDFQVQSSRLADPNDISSAISTTQNAKKASSRGFEIEAFGRVTEQLSVAFNVGYNDAKFDDYKNAVLKGTQNGIPNVVNVSGQALPRTPKWSLSSTIDYGYDINDDWDGFVRLDWSYTGKTVSDIEGVASQVGQTVNGQAFNLPKLY